MILGLVPLSLRLLLFSPCFLTLLQFSVCPISSTPRIAFSWFLPPTQFPSPFWKSHFPCFLSFPCQSPLPWRYLGLQKQRGKDMWHTSHVEAATYTNFASLGLLRGRVSLCNDARVATLIGLPCSHACTHAHTQWESCKFITNGFHGIVLISPV